MIGKTWMPVHSRQGIVDLVEYYKRFASDRAREAERRVNELKAHLGTFWPQFKDSCAAYAERERTEAPRFNLVRLLELERLESHHSRILADLLDPRGTHGQGALFLERFLDLIGLSHIKAKVASPAAHVEVTPEERITAESRPDIVVRCVPWFVLVIENKIQSGEGQSDGTWQLEKYCNWLRDQTAEEKRLLFLTIHGEKSSSGAESLLISYTRHIHGWLEECLNRVTAPSVQHTLLQYLETIENLRNLKRETADGSE